MQSRGTQERYILGLGLSAAGLSLLELGLKVGDAVVEGDGLLLLGGDLGLGGSEVALSSLGTGMGSVGLSTKTSEFLQQQIVQLKGTCELSVDRSFEAEVWQFHDRA
jgi:hypothetical protein